MPKEEQIKHNIYLVRSMVKATLSTKDLNDDQGMKEGK